MRIENRAYASKTDPHHFQRFHQFEDFGSSLKLSPEQMHDKGMLGDTDWPPIRERCVNIRGSAICL